MEMQDIEGGSWMKFQQVGDTAEGVFKEFFVKEARELFPEQLVIVLTGADGSETNVWFSTANPRYANSIRNMKAGHYVKVSLTGYYNQDTQTSVTEPGKTKKGMSFAKQYKFEMSKDPVAPVAPVTHEISIDDAPF